MIVRAYRSTKCKTIAKYKVKHIYAMPEDREEARHYMEIEATPLLSLELENGEWVEVPPEFVIEIKEESK